MTTFLNVLSSLAIVIMIATVINRRARRAKITATKILGAGYWPEIEEPPDVSTAPEAEPAPALWPANVRVLPTYMPVGGEKVLYETHAGNWLVARTVGSNEYGFVLRRRHCQFAKPISAIRPRLVAEKVLAVAA